MMERLSGLKPATVEQLLNNEQWLLKVGHFLQKCTGPEAIELSVELQPAFGEETPFVLQFMLACANRAHSGQTGTKV